MLEFCLYWAIYCNIMMAILGGVAKGGPGRACAHQTPSGISRVIES